MKAHLFTPLLVLAGCATTGTQIQAGCEAQHAQFKSVVECTQAGIARQNPRILQDPRAKLYMLRGHELASEVDAGRISEASARVAWQRMYLEFETASRAELAESIERMTRRPAARQDEISCTSRRLGNEVQTKCER